MLTYIYTMWQALVKVEDSPQHIPPKRCTKPSNNKLWLKDGLWRKRIIPSIFRWASIQENPWIVADEKITDTLTKICEAHFGDLEHPITSDSEPIRIVSPCCSLRDIHLP